MINAFYSDEDLLILGVVTVLIVILLYRYEYLLTVNLENVGDILEVVSNCF